MFPTGETIMANEQAENGKGAAVTAAERFRTHLRVKLQEMRDNACRIGASSRYIEELDRSAEVVLTAIAAGSPANKKELNPAE
jgi:hypothetical protein